MANPRKSQHQPRFNVGDAVRVAGGVSDPDFPDIPLGGWVGTVKEVDQTSRQCHYLIAWTAETLKNISPVFQKRCERDGLVLDEMTLAEEDIEAYDGQALSIEQPVKINTRKASPKNQDDRIRLILEATGDDPVPEVNVDTLLAYWKYLDEHLTIPFDAKFCPEHGRHGNVTVVGLADPDEYDIDEFYGLSCEARLGGRQITVPLGEIEVKAGEPNHQLIDDYSYWFWNWR